jgi:sialate O-acetylesterase
MINPLIPYALQGAIWYQGESNAGRAYEYRKLFPMLIEDWRKQWTQDLDFYWVQLANFMPAQPEPGPSDWAELREAQDMTLSLPRTGQAVIIDIGEAGDIHPLNKEEVGLRLALQALHKNYNQDIVYEGPRYRSINIEGNKAIISFDHTGSGLEALRDKYGYPKGFAIAGADRKFHWAQARIVGNTVEVYSPQVPRPVAVRYAWANNPDDANLYNREGLPTAPFRTDDWDGITKGKIKEY